MSRSAVLFLLLFAPVLSVVLALLGLQTLNRNLIGWALLLIGIAYPAATIGYYGVHRRLLWDSIGEVVQHEQGDTSFWVMIPGMLVVFFASPLEYLYLDHEPTLPLWIQISGLALILASAALVLWARLAIRGWYSSHLQVLADQSLITAGPYRLARHPSYGGLVLLNLGIAAGYGSLIGLLAIPFLVIPALLYRMAVEEHILVQRFGDQYRNYQQHVKRLVPGLW